MAVQRAVRGAVPRFDHPSEALAWGLPPPGSFHRPSKTLIPVSLLFADPKYGRLYYAKCHYYALSAVSWMITSHQSHIGKAALESLLHFATYMWADFRSDAQLSPSGSSCLLLLYIARYQYSNHLSVERSSTQCVYKISCNRQSQHLVSHPEEAGPQSHMLASIFISLFEGSFYALH